MCFEADISCSQGQHLKYYSWAFKRFREQWCSIGRPSVDPLQIHFTDCKPFGNIHIMLIFIILGARLRQDEDTDSGQAPKLMERQDDLARPPEPLSIPFSYDKLRRIGQAWILKGHRAFPHLGRSQGSLLLPKAHIHTWFCMSFVGLQLSKGRPLAPTALWTPWIFKKSLLPSGWIEM